MVETSVVAEMAAGQSDALLATKLYLPALRSGLVPRRRLDERLDGALGQGVVLVVAPAGYGKTVLLADWPKGPVAYGVAVVGRGRQ